jgi:hypothetical protein
MRYRLVNNSSRKRSRKWIQLYSQRSNQNDSVAADIEKAILLLFTKALSTCAAAFNLHRRPPDTNMQAFQFPR